MIKDFIAIEVSIIRERDFFLSFEMMKVFYYTRREVYKSEIWHLANIFRVY